MAESEFEIDYGKIIVPIIELALLSVDFLTRVCPIRRLVLQKIYPEMKN